jgi:CheY-like chemotaxis protein
MFNTVERSIERMVMTCGGYSGCLQVRGRNKILVVDDEPIVLRMVSSSLDADYGVFIADNGATGLEMFRQHHDEIALVLTDVKMPVMGGLEMADAILKEAPHTPILLMTAYSEELIGPGNPHRLPIIRKPFLGDALLRRIAELLDNAAPA